MAYERQNFIDGEFLYADQLNHMEEGIISIEKKIEESGNGKDGITPHIGANGNWFIGDNDTGVKASGKDGEDGQDGLTPYIGLNGNWHIGDYDTGVKAEGQEGKSAYQYAQDGGYTGTETEFAEKLAEEYPKKVSQLENDSKYITASGAPVQSVNGKTGAVKLGASDVGALPATYVPPDQTAEQVGADPKGAAASAVSQHNTADDSHNDIRLELKAINDRLTAFFDSDDQTLDELSEIVAYITSNKTLIDSITTSKVSVADIINNLTTNVTNKPLSAAQGVVLKGLIDAVSKSLSNYQPKGDYALRSELPTVPTKVSAFTNDAGYLTEHQDISGKLDANKLPEAIDAALAQAKDSGDFDGLTPHIGTNGNWFIGDIDTGVKAEGKDGKTHDVSVSSVTRTVALPDGTWGCQDGVKIEIKTYLEDGRVKVNFADVWDGVDGHTPVRGVDYWNPDDVADIESYIVNELAKRNQTQLIFVKSVEEMTDTTKLYVYDGEIWAYMAYENSVPGGQPLFTNKADPTSSDWNTDKRLSFSSGNMSACTGAIVSNAIPMQRGDTIRVKGLRNGTTTATASAFVGLNGYSDNEGTTKSWGAPMSFTKTRVDGVGGIGKLTTIEDGAFVYKGFPFYSTGTDETNNTPTERPESVVCVRVCGEPVTTVDDIIVTINEKIEYSQGSTETGYRWQSTGHAFVPADYEERIDAVEKKATQNTTKIAALEKAVESGSADETEAAALTRIQKWDKPIYDSAPVTLIADSRAKPALTTNDRTIDGIYAKYRALMAAHPDYIKETNMGKSTASDTFTAVDMLRFDFCEPGGLTEPTMSDAGRHETKPTLILLSGIHKEWVGVWGLYYALEEITTNPDFDDIRRNAHIIVIPCANPFGLTSQTAIEGWVMSHVNANGVAIHNNFGVNHSTSGVVGAYNYGGSAPYSELETQYIDAVMAEYPDAVAFVSCHNCDYNTFYEAPVIWASSATYHMCNMAFRLVDKMSKAWLDKYGQTLKDSIDAIKINMDANDYRLGSVTMSTSKGTEQLNATKYGIMGVNLEITRMMKVFSGNTDGTSEVMTHGAEVYANFMRTILWSYDHKDKKEYAPNLPWSE